MKNVSMILLTFGMLACGQVMAGEDAVTDQINPAHDGTIVFEQGFAPPLTLKWSRDLGGPVSYPVTANGMVFVTVGNPYGTPGTQLFALDITTGAVVWQKAIEGSLYWSNLAYDNGQVFVLNNDGILQAFSADSAGKLNWRVQIPNNSSFTASPTAAQGQVFVCGGSGEGHLSAVDETTGAVNWTAGVQFGDVSSPARGDGGVYVAFPGRYYRFDENTGNQEWLKSKQISGGGGYTPVYFEQRVHMGKEIRDAKTGGKLEKLPADQPPSFWDNAAGERFGIAFRRSKLEATNLNTGSIVWRFAGDGQITTAPIIIGDMAVVGSKTGKVYLVSVESGRRAWATNVGAPILPSGASGAQSRPWTGLGAGEDTLLVPASNILAAYTQGAK